jgi:hypothetical protein
MPVAIVRPDLRLAGMNAGTVCVLRAPLALRVCWIEGKVAANTGEAAVDAWSDIADRALHHIDINICGFIVVG